MKNVIVDKVTPFILLTFASVSMTLGNKFLMATPLKHHKILTLALQNAIAVSVMSLLMLTNITSMVRVSKAQLLYVAERANL